MGPSPISQAEMLAWQQNYRVALTPWELDTLFDMDRAVLAELSENGKNHGNADRNATD